MSDVINHPQHYKRSPSGVECITVTEHMGFNLGNAVKYIWRADFKGKALEDLKKAQFYLAREIANRQKAAQSRKRKVVKAVVKKVQQATKAMKKPVRVTVVAPTGLKGTLKKKVTKMVKKANEALNPNSSLI